MPRCRKSNKNNKIFNFKRLKFISTKTATLIGPLHVPPCANSSRGSESMYSNFNLSVLFHLAERLRACTLAWASLLFNMNDTKFILSKNMNSLVFIVRPGSFLRFNSRPIMYGAVGSQVLSWSWTRQLEFISFRCFWIQLCNNFG